MDTKEKLNKIKKIIEIASKYNLDVDVELNVFRFKSKASLDEMFDEIQENTKEKISITDQKFKDGMGNDNICRYFEIEDETLRVSLYVKHKKR